MKIIDCVQGTPAWKAARLGMPTASQFGRIMSAKTLKPLAGAETYALELLAEWALGVMEDEGSGFMERGHGLEESAIAAYELETGRDVTRIGFLTNDAGTIGCSPDGLVGEEGGLEIKCPAAKTHLAYLLAPGDVGPYAPQIQGALWLTGRAWWDWRSWHPTLPAAAVHVERDERFIAALAQIVEDFVGRLTVAKADLEKLGVTPFTTATAGEDLTAAFADVLA